MLTPGGKPVERWRQGIPLDAHNRPTIFKHAAREPNPNALQRFPVLTDDDLLDLCYPRLAFDEVQGAQRWDRIRMAKEALRELRDAGHIILIEDTTSPDGQRRGWKILREDLPPHSTS